jgi:2-oxoglutarate ferredoxin oxidoreductase subunit alpha
MAMANQFHFMIGGAAGEGIMVTGLMLAKFASRSGYQVFDFVDYPSLIRGGHNAYYGTIGTEEVFSTHNQVDLLIALNQETISLHQGQLNPQAGIIYDPDKFSQEKIAGVNLYPVPLAKLAQQAGHQLMANTVALGAMIALTGGSLTIFNSVLADAFKDKKPEVV